MKPIFESLLVSFLVSAAVSSGMAIGCLKRFDRYTDELLKDVKEFLNDLLTVLNKRV